MARRHQLFAVAAVVVSAGELAGEIGTRLGLRALIGDAGRIVIEKFTDRLPMGTKIAHNVEGRILIPGNAD